MDDVEVAFDAFEIDVGADEADLRDYAEWLEEVVRIAKERLAAAREDLMGG